MSEQNKFDSTYSAVLSIANNLIEQGKYDSTYSAVLSIYQNLTGDNTTSFDSVYSIVVNIAEGIESGEIDLGGGSDIELVPLNETVTYNGLHQFVPVDGVAYNQVDITVDIPNETLTQTITTNGTYDYAPSEGFFNGVSVTVDVPTGGGGSGSEEQDFSPKIRFFDFDGNIVESWTLDEAKTKTVDDLPVLKEIQDKPFYLYFDGWNTPLQDMHETTSDIAVGSMWEPSDGNSWIKVNIGPENLTTILFMEVLGDCVIDWGDGTTDDADTVSGYPQHTYDSAGEKWIKIIGDWNPQWGVSSDLTAVYGNYPGWYYHNQITEIYLGRGVNRCSFGCLRNVKYITFPNIQHKLSHSSFQQDVTLKNLYLPYSVQITSGSAASGAFYKCYGLEVISWRGWTYEQYGSDRYHQYLGQYQFSSLRNLRYTTIYHTVKGIGGYAFEYCSSLQSVTIPDSVTQTDYYVFQYCSSLQSVTIPNSVKTIGNFTFKSCSSLQSVTIPDSVTSISQSVFQSCSSLQSVTIPDSVTSIGYYAFQYCSSLQSVTIPNSVKTIGEYAFSDCGALQSITIPDSVTSIGRYAFKNCGALQSITIPDSVTSIDPYAFQYCSSLRSVTIPDSVTQMGTYTFDGCISLQSVNMSNSVTLIGDCVFQRCISLQSIAIPNSVTYVYKYAFSSIDYLMVDFSQHTRVPTLSSTNAFGSTAIILVPSALYDEWINATNWSSIASQIIAV